MPDTTTPSAINLDTFHDSILERIAAQFPDFQEVKDYPRAVDKVPTPACYVMMTEANPAADPGTDQLKLTLRFEALVIYGFKAEKSKRSVRAAAVDLALFIKNQRWGAFCGPATIEGIQADGFSPELDAYNVWRVDWTQDAYVGPSVWDDTAVPNPFESVIVREDVVPEFPV